MSIITEFDEDVMKGLSVKKYDDQKSPPKTPKPNIKPKPRKINENHNCPFCGAIVEKEENLNIFIIYHKETCIFNILPLFDGKLLELDDLPYWNKRHKEIKKYTIEYQEKIMKQNWQQCIEISNQIKLVTFYKIKLTCPDCNRKISMRNLYRCFQCGLYICKTCAPDHFGIYKSKLSRYIKEKK